MSNQGWHSLEGMCVVGVISQTDRADLGDAVLFCFAAQEHWSHTYFLACHEDHSLRHLLLACPPEQERTNHISVGCTVFTRLCSCIQDL